MQKQKLLQKARKFARPFGVIDGRKFRLKDVDPGNTLGLNSEAKPRAKQELQIGVSALAKFQDMLYAQGRWAVLLIFQAMDAAGKDGTIKHVMSGVNPQAARCSPSNRPLSKNSIMIFFGAA